MKPKFTNITVTVYETVILGTQEAVGWMAVIVTGFLLFLLQYRMTTVVEQNEWMALPI